MTSPSMVLDFGTPDRAQAALAAQARGMRASEILQIAAEIRALQASGRTICNLTVGDFDPAQFPIPDPLRVGTQDALAAHQTNYPPGDGLPELREAIREYTAREWSVDYPREAILVTSGCRPGIYATFRTLLNPGDRVVYGIPSWNNEHYAHLTGAVAVPVRTTRAGGFQPTAEELAPHLPDAKLLCLCSPANPTGTLLSASEMERILHLVVAENQRRQDSGQAPLFVLHDQVYGSLVFGSHRHVHPLALVPDAAPYVVSLDGISKAYAATGLRVGWCMAPPLLAGRMRDFLSHVGAWAPRAEQVATARFLRDPTAIGAFRESMDQAVSERLTALADGVLALKAEGYPIDCVAPEGAIYLSLQLDLVGRLVDGWQVEDNEAIRSLLLEHAGWAAVPFQAFGLTEQTGWFRLSVGAVSPGEIAAALPRIRAMLQRVAN